MPTSFVPCPPRVAVIDPSYLVPQLTLDEVHAGKDDKESHNRPIFSSAPRRPVFCADKPVFLVSQQSSRLPDLAHQILPCSHARRVSHVHPYYSGATRNSIMASVSVPLGTHLHQGYLPAGKIKTRVQPTDAVTNLQHSHDYPTHKLHGISRQQAPKDVRSTRREWRTCVWSDAFHGES
ncbi:hypothetical protein F4604DRAFT_711211 [Suillus subluteus]|nr:hypothetical protein F4604DRAFT_711211 [Suillus subluteus]